MANKNFLNQMRSKTGVTAKPAAKQPETLATKEELIGKMEETPVESASKEQSKTASPHSSVFDAPNLESLNLDDFDEDDYDGENNELETNDNDFDVKESFNSDNEILKDIEDIPEPVESIEQITEVVVEEKPRRRGRPPRNQNPLPQIPDTPRQNKVETNPSKGIKERPKTPPTTPIQNIETVPVPEKKTKKAVMKFDVEGETPKLVIVHVCKQTISNLLKTYKSSIYTQEFAADLFNKFINDETSASTDALFKALITECIEKSVVDEYLGPELTIKILKYIQER